MIRFMLHTYTGLFIQIGLIILTGYLFQGIEIGLLVLFIQGVIFCLTILFLSERFSEYLGRVIKRNLYD